MLLLFVIVVIVLVVDFDKTANIISVTRIDRIKATKGMVKSKNSIKLINQNKKQIRIRIRK